MRSSSVVKVEIPADQISRLGDGFVGSQIDLLVFDAFPQPLNEHVVPPGPFAVHADGDAWLASRPVNAAPVNCDPWSVLKISGLPWRAKASSRVSTQKAASIVIDSRHDRTRRVAQSSTTAR